MEQLKSMIVIGICVLAFSCVKEGPVGPAGPAGPPGQDGGVPENVQFESLTITSADWTQLNNGLSCSYEIPALTQEVIDSAGVFLSMKRNNLWYVLPAQVYTVQFTWNYQLGRVNVYVSGTQLPFNLPCKLVWMSDPE